MDDEKVAQRSKGSSTQNSWNSPPPLNSIPVSYNEFKSNFFLRFCAILNAFTSVAGSFSALVHLALIIHPCNGSSFSARSSHHWPSVIVRCYCVGFGILAIFLERESIFVFKNFFFLESWISRGLFLIFCGALQVTSSETPCEPCSWDGLSAVAGYTYGTLGFLYFVLGCFCFKQLQQRELTHIRKRKQIILQAQQLTAHKSQIETLLKETEEKIQGLV